MISKIDISGVNLDLNDDIKRYAVKKFGYLDKYLPRNVRGSVRAEVKIRLTNNRLGNKYECEAIIHVPEKMLSAKESTVNMFAAVDIVEQKMKNLCIKYKQQRKIKLFGSRSGLIDRLRQIFSR